MDRERNELERLVREMGERLREKLKEGLRGVRKVVKEEVIGQGGEIRKELERMRRIEGEGEEMGKGERRDNE